MRKSIIIIFCVSFLASCFPILVRFFFSDCRLIDLGFRARTENIAASPAFVIGENIRQASQAVPKAEYADDQRYFQALFKYFKKELVIWDKKFPDQERMDILRKYGNRNSEGIIKDGFYYGCADLCTVIGSVLIHNGYRCKLIYTVSEEFSISEYRNIGHVYLYIDNGAKTFLYDPGMSREIIENYKIGTREIRVKSIIGDQFIYAVQDQPGNVSLIDWDIELQMRREAAEYWSRFKLK